MKKGFTLVEVMIVVAIVGLSAAIIIPNIMVSKFKTATGIKNTEYAMQLMKKTHNNVKEAKLLVEDGWGFESKDILVCPKCKYVFGHYKLVEN